MMSAVNSVLKEYKDPVLWTLQKAHTLIFRALKLIVCFLLKNMNSQKRAQQERTRLKDSWNCRKLMDHLTSLDMFLVKNRKVEIDAP